MTHPLPPLPLLDGCLFVDNSGWMESISMCHRLLEYRSLRQRISAMEKPALNFGSIIHEGLDLRYRTYRHRKVDDTFYEQFSQKVTSFFNLHPAPIDDWRGANWAMETMRQYNSKYEVEDFGLLIDESTGGPLVELSFVIKLFTYRNDSLLPLLSPEQQSWYHKNNGIVVIYTGRIDLPVFIEGNIWVMDHKTAGTLGDSFWSKMKMSTQQKGYCWSFEKLTGQKVSGYIVNAIRSKQPPLYVLRGEASRSTGKKLSSQEWWNESLVRERYWIQPGMLDEWYHNTVHLIKEFFFNYIESYMPMETAYSCSAYGKCAYYDVCTLAPEDRMFMLSSGQYTDNEWSPLKQPSQPKQ